MGYSRYFAEKAFNSASDSVMFGNIAVNNDLNFSRAMLAFSRKKSYSQQFLKSKSYLHRTFFSFSCQKKNKKKQEFAFTGLEKANLLFAYADITDLFWTTNKCGFN